MLAGSGIASFSYRGRDAARGGGCRDNVEQTLQRLGWLNGLFYDPNPRARASATGTREDLLRMRASTTMLRLRTASEVAARLTLHNTGPAQMPTLMAGHVDGRGLAGAGFAELLYLINADKQAATLEVPARSRAAPSCSARCTGPPARPTRARCAMRAETPPPAR